MAKARDGVLTGGLSGSLGGLVAVRGASGTVLRNPPRRSARRTEAQRQQELRVERVAAYWSRMTPEGAQAWREYAASLCALLPASERRPMSAYQAFFSLTGRLLQVDPLADVPMLPPASAFPGDAVSVTVGPLPLPPLQDKPLGEGTIVFAANRANAPGVLTELLLQPLANGTRLPTPRGYRSQRFVSFTDDAPSATVEVTPGWYACAYRFVEAATGRDTDLFPCGIVLVP